jgi:hypothetical protein
VLIYSFLQDDDHGYVVGTAIQSVQRPLESTGKRNYFRVKALSAHSTANHATKCQSKLEQNYNFKKINPSLMACFASVFE